MCGRARAPAPTQQTKNSFQKFKITTMKFGEKNKLRIFNFKKGIVA
jgi:hypothetical protein